MSLNRNLTDMEIMAILAAIKKGLCNGEIQVIANGFVMSIFGQFSASDDGQVLFHRNDGFTTEIHFGLIKIYAPLLKIAGAQNCGKLTILPIRQE